MAETLYPLTGLKMWQDKIDQSIDHPGLDIIFWKYMLMNHRPKRHPEPECNLFESGYLGTNVSPLKKP